MTSPTPSPRKGWEWAWYGDNFIVTETDDDGAAIQQIVMPREWADKLSRYAEGVAEGRRDRVRATKLWGEAFAEGVAEGRRQAAEIAASHIEDGKMPYVDTGAMWRRAAARSIAEAIQGGKDVTVSGG